MRTLAVCASTSVSEDRLETSSKNSMCETPPFYHCVPVESSEIHSCHEVNYKEMEARVSKVDRALKSSCWMSKRHSELLEL